MKDNKLLKEYCQPYIGMGDWKPDRDWNQLMQVVEKIEEEAGAVIITDNECVIRGKYMEGVNKIDAVYHACVGYINLK